MHRRGWALSAHPFLFNCVIRCQYVWSDFTRLNMYLRCVGLRVNVASTPRVMLLHVHLHLLTICPEVLRVLRTRSA